MAFWQRHAGSRQLKSHWVDKQRGGAPPPHGAACAVPRAHCTLLSVSVSLCVMSLSVLSFRLFLGSCLSSFRSAGIDRHATRRLSSKWGLEEAESEVFCFVFVSEVSQLSEAVRCFRSGQCLTVPDPAWLLCRDCSFFLSDWRVWLRVWGLLGDRQCQASHKLGDWQGRQIQETKLWWRDHRTDNDTK